MNRSPLLLLLALAACPRTPPGPGPADVVVVVETDARAPLGDAAPLDDCGRACQHLGALGCPEGAKASCAATCRDVGADKLVPLALPCVLAAGSPAAVRACAPTWKCL